MTHVIIPYKGRLYRVTEVGSRSPLIEIQSVTRAHQWIWWRPIKSDTQRYRDVLAKYEEEKL